VYRTEGSPTSVFRVSLELVPDRLVPCSPRLPGRPSGATLFSADRRAEPTYEAMEVETYFVDPE